ncbi:hypothetical protein [Iningainema tapete]|nr:hypothetical protein [Iningainema tapete]
MLKVMTVVNAIALDWLRLLVCLTSRSLDAQRLVVRHRIQKVL